MKGPFLELGEGKRQADPLALQPARVDPGLEVAEVSDRNPHNDPTAEPTGRGGETVRSSVFLYPPTVFGHRAAVVGVE